MSATEDPAQDPVEDLAQDPVEGHANGVVEDLAQDLVGLKSGTVGVESQVGVQSCAEGVVEEVVGMVVVWLDVGDGVLFWKSMNIESCSSVGTI